MRKRIVIVGGGVAGLATAWHLGRRRVGEVLLLEGEPALGQHSTAKNAAILRSSIGDPIDDELAAEGARFLLKPPAGFAPGPLIAPTGVLLVARSERGAELDPWLERARTHAHDLRELEPAAFRALAPHFGSAVGRALWAPGEGRIDLDSLVAGYARGARAAGVELATGAQVADLLVDDQRVHGVRLADGTRIEADRVALAAGGWAGVLGARAGSRVRLQPTRRHLTVTRPDARVDPRWPVVWSLDGAFYTRPASGGLMFCACDEEPVDPDACVADPAELERIRASAREHVGPLGELEPARFWAGMRTFSDDRRFLVGPDPELLGLVWVAGLGGHGIVCGAAVGRRAAAWLDPRDELDRSGLDAVGRALDPRRLAQRADAR